MNKIQAISGLCGSGKTTEMISLISESTHLQHIIVVPSRDLCVEIQSSLIAQSVNATIINSDTHTNTTHSIVNHLNTHQPDHTKHVVVITHASFRLMDITSTKGWHVWHDELPCLFQGSKLWYDCNVVFDDYFTIGSDKSITLTKLSLSSSNHDGLNSDLKGLIHGLKTGRFNAYAVSRDDEKMHVNVMTIIRPEYFPANTTLLSAGIEDSLVYRMLLHNDAIEAPLVLETNIVNHYTTELEIVYAMDNFNTRHLRETYPEEFNAAVTALCDMVRGKCIAVANEDIKLPSKFERLTHNVHGMNKYTSYSNVMFLSALNLNPEALSLLEEVLKVPAEAVYLDRTVSIAYQVAMRGALRLEKPVEGYKIFVMEKRLAEALRDTYFPNATITGLEGYSVKLKPRGRPKGKVEPLTSQERKKVHKLRVMAKEGKFDAMTNYRIISGESRAIMKLPVWNQH